MLINHMILRRTILKKSALRLPCSGPGSGPRLARARAQLGPGPGLSPGSARAEARLGSGPAPAPAWAQGLGEKDPWAQGPEPKAPWAQSRMGPRPPGPMATGWPTVSCKISKIIACLKIWTYIRFLEAILVGNCAESRSESYESAPRI